MVFYRSLLQLFVSGLVLAVWKKPIFATPGLRMKLLFHTLVGSLSVFGMLFSSQRLFSQELAGIFLITPVPTLIMEQFFQRGLKSLHVTLFIMTAWMCSVLLITHNLPWPSSIPSNETNSTATERWQPPLFGLDNTQMWPILPNQYANADEAAIGALRVSGFTIGILGMVSLSAVPVLASFSTSDILFQVLWWQAGGALLSSLVGLVIHGNNFAFPKTIDWVYCALVASMGVLGNAANFVFLSQKQRDRVRGGWPNQVPTMPGILIGVVARSSLEVVSIYAINLMTINNGVFNGGEWIGVGVLLFLGLFSCFVNRGQKVQTGNSSDCSVR